MLTWLHILLKMIHFNNPSKLHKTAVLQTNAVQEERWVLSSYHTLYGNNFLFSREPFDIDKNLVRGTKTFLRFSFEDIRQVRLVFLIKGVVEFVRWWSVVCMYSSSSRFWSYLEKVSQPQLYWRTNMQMPTNACIVCETNYLGIQRNYNTSEYPEKTWILRFEPKWNFVCIRFAIFLQQTFS